MKQEYKRDIGWGVFFLLMAISIWILVPYQIPISGKTHMGPRFFPKVISLIMATMSLGLILSNYIKHSKDLKEGKAEQGGKSIFNREFIQNEFRAVLVLALMVLYAVLMPLVGFIISSVVISCTILILLGARKWYYFVIMMATVFLTFYLFKYQLYVQLP